MNDWLQREQDALHAALHQQEMDDRRKWEEQQAEDEIELALIRAVQEIREALAKLREAR